MDAKEITLIGDIMGTDGVQALSIRPNAATAYGTSGLSAGDLKLWFDKVPTTLVEKIDEVIGIINGVEFAEYIKTDYEGEPKTLADVFEAIGNGDFTAFLQAGKSDGKNGSLQDILDGIYKELQALDLPQDYTLSEYLELFKGGIKAEIENPEGEVEAGEHLPVSGGKVFEAIQEANLDVSALWGRVGDLDETVGQNKEKAEKNEKRIALLEMANEGNTYAFTKHEDIEYNHPVPPTALPYARLDSIGGYTRRSKNLLKLTPNMSIPLTGDELPITCSTDEEGYFCIDGDGGVSGFFDCLSLFVSKPSSIVISARYIAGSVSGPAEGVDADLVLLGNTIKAPTPQNPLTYLAVSSVKYNTDEYNMAIGNFTNYKIALMVEEGTTATEYEPYFEGLKSAKVKAVKSYKADGTWLDTYTVPSAVQSIDGYGLGIGTDYANTVDYSANIYTENVKEVDLGTLDFRIYNSNASRVVFTAQIDDIKEHPNGTLASPYILCDRYRTVAQEDSWVTGDIAQSSRADDRRSIRIAESPNMTLADFVAKIDGVKLLYVLSEPNVTPIAEGATDTV